MIKKTKRFRLVIFVIILMAIILGACTDNPSTMIENNEVKNSTASVQQSSNSTTDDISIANNSNELQNTQNDVQASQTQIIGAKENKGMLKDKLFSEFKDHYNKVINSENIEYNQIMGSIKGGEGLLTTFKKDLSEEQFSFAEQHYMEVAAALKFCPVRGGYSSDGVKFLAILTPTDIESNNFKNAVNEIRGLNDEYDYMSNIPDLYSERCYYLGIDLYAEDLLDAKKEIKVDKILIYDSAAEGTSSYEEIELSTDSHIFNKTDYLSKYNRKPINDPKIIKNKSWNTYIYDAVNMISLKIIIEYNGESISLNI